MINSNQSRAPRWVIWGATALITLGCGLRLANLGQFVPWHDEIATLHHVAAQPEHQIIQSWPGKVQVFADLQQNLATEPRRRAIDTIRSLATTDAHHPPLYYLVMRLWADWFGNTIKSLRAATALIGVLLLPSVFWLLREAAPDRPSLPWIGTVLVALSPLQVLYAQEAREYTLWLVFSVLSSGWLLRALRQSTPKNCTIYTLTLVLYPDTCPLLVQPPVRGSDFAGPRVVGGATGPEPARSPWGGALDYGLALVTIDCSNDRGLWAMAVGAQPCGSQLGGGTPVAEWPLGRPVKSLGRSTVDHHGVG